MFMDELLGTELDKLGNEIKVRFCMHEHMSVMATAFFLRQWAELIELGFADPNYIPDITSCRVLYLIDNDTIIGLRIWSWHNNTTNIILTSIDKNYRRRGLFEILSKYYDRRVIYGNGLKSKTQIHVNNIAMIKAAEKTGYEIEFLRMAKKYK